MLRSFSDVGAKIRRKIDKIEDVNGNSKRAANLALARGTRPPPTPPPQNPAHHAKPSQSNQKIQIRIP
jgi:hypothetical protein